TTSTAAPGPSPASRTSRLVDMAAHSSPLVVATVVAIAVGQPIGWIAFLFPVGPLVVTGIAAGIRDAAPRGARSLVAFTFVAAIVVGGGWLLTGVGDLWAPLALLFPFGLLAFIAGLVNFVLVITSRVGRAWRGWAFDYPWIPDRVARLVGLPDGWEE
ncbi:MAG: hypothetical protein AAFP84_16030, partial [Actinomycetota bacterium]